MTFPCRWGCGSWLHTDPSIRSAGGKCLPLTENNEVHRCHLNPWYRNQGAASRNANTRTRPQAIAIQRIDEYQLINDIREHMAHVNTRLSNYILDLHVKPKQTQLNVEEDF